MSSQQSALSIQPAKDFGNRETELGMVTDHLTRPRNDFFM
jgi:hypothetical protein